MKKKLLLLLLVSSFIFTACGTVREETTDIIISETTISVDATDVTAQETTVESTETTSESISEYMSDPYASMEAGTFRLNEGKQIMIKRATVEPTDLGNVYMSHFAEDEVSYELTDDASIYLYYPVDDANGASVTIEEFLSIIRDTQIDCYYQLNEEGKIEEIIGVFYS